MISRTMNAMVVKTGGQNVRIPIQITMTFDLETDPFAVQMICSAAGEPDVVWHLGRDLLAEGIESRLAHGEGDIKFRHEPKAGAVYICLKNTEGHADLAMSYRELAAFIGETNQALEGLDLDLCASNLVDEFLKEEGLA